MGLVRACEPRLLIPGRGGRSSESPAWEALNPSVLLKTQKMAILGKQLRAGGRIVPFLCKSFVLNPEAELQLV